jgi:hypothetical protein
MRLRSIQFTVTCSKGSTPRRLMHLSGPSFGNALVRLSFRNIFFGGNRKCTRLTMKRSTRHITSLCYHKSAPRANDGNISMIDLVFPIATTRYSRLTVGILLSIYLLHPSSLALIAERQPPDPKGQMVYIQGVD